ncbi:Universal stress protein family protein [Pseudobythopirellula maris]|uniref:Universal stress protein family protein n=1 Tax=Pseudobythopirellula maris TaxID=2527991 RepID=A0A5C5ZML5_9BACT|nr:universal stress protein [Pseudobythopirellula maris]TWT88659.1 Universal stress protein family protein [Pseudobythopirellula maris]
MIGRILLGIGGTDCAESSIHTAVDLARRHDAELTGVTLLGVKQLMNVGPVPIGAGGFAADLREHRLQEARERAEEGVEQFADACQEAKVRFSVLREERDEAFNYLVSQSRYHDLVVLGLHGAFELGMPGEPHYDPSVVLMKLITGGVRPLLAVGPEVRDYHRAMIAYSGSVASAKTMKRFVQMRPWGDMRVRIVAFGHDAERRRSHLQHAAEYCRANGLEPETHHHDGPAKGGLLEAADDWGADLIVMGNSARNLLVRRVLGDTMLDTVQRSPLPLFLGQ